jgi:signal transduction histidine kinase
VVRNLVSNAIRYGGPQIHIRLENGDDHVRVTVFDDGAAIPEEHRDRIFDPYERAHSTSGVPGSVGLGLTVSQKLAELMGGSITYRFDGGSIFELQVEAAASSPGDA